MGEKRSAYKSFVVKPEGKSPLGRHRHRLKENIKMDPRDIGFGDTDWINLTQDRNHWRALVNMSS
jgi:hypothetical protein